MKTKNIVLISLGVIIIVISIIVIYSKSKKNELAEKEKTELAKKNLAKSTEDNIAWELKSFAADPGEQSGKKYIETYTEGIFSNPATTRGKLYVQVILTKMSAGFLLHKTSKAVPSLKIDGTATITFKSPDLEELKLSSIESWSANGGIKVNNHGGNKHLAFYDQIKDFMSKSKGDVLITITDEHSSTYSFYISSKGFSKEFILL